MLFSGFLRHEKQLPSPGSKCGHYLKYFMMSRDFLFVGMSSPVLKCRHFLKYFMMTFSGDQKVNLNLAFILFQRILFMVLTDNT